MDRYDVLRQYFGYDAFRAGQEPLIEAVCSGRDAVGVMPTGGGKSLCYQVPSLLLEGVTLVISPLISLMKDQVMALCAAGVPAAYLNSSLTAPQQREVCARLLDGAYRIVYVAPERLCAGRFPETAARLRIPLLAVDEAHCISQWGQDFRPSYLRIPEFVASLPRRPVLAAYTATATQQVREDIERLLELDDPLRIVTGFDRPNLNFEVLRPENKTASLLRLVRARRGKSGIVYCATRSGVERVCRTLCEAGIPATRYHAGLSDEERRHNQEDFVYDRRPVMAATNAFGMGIDKSNVSYVIHYNMPKSLEAYYQEAGRAGRDGTPADCILLYSPGDVATARRLIELGGENEALTDEQRSAVRRQELARLDAMVDYCRTERCLRGCILGYFGQAHPERCGACGSCQEQAGTVRTDVTTDAQKLLSCVRRARDRLGYSVGASLIIQTLCGSREKRVLELGLDGLTTYGLLRGRPRTQVRALFEQLEHEGYLYTDPSHGGVSLTEQAGEVLYRGKTVSMPVRVRQDAAPARRGAAGPDGPEQADDGLFEALRTLRAGLARQEGVPAYMVFGNAALADMAAKAPTSMEAFLAVSGVGQYKAERYGAAFLSEIQRYLKEHGES